MKTFFFLFFLVSYSMFSQYKFEREYRISEDEIPQKAKDFITNCNFDKKIKWYAEESQDGKTYEAKSCKNKNKYSVEFNTNGTVLDVEKTIKWKEIPEPNRKKITQSLKNRFDSFRIKKVQIQWKTNPKTYIKLMNKEEVNNVNTNYEIVLKGKEKKSTNLFELLIDTEGTIVKELKFAPQNSDNLEF